MKNQLGNTIKSFEFGRYVAIAEVKESNKVFVNYEYANDGSAIIGFAKNTDMELVLGMCRNWCIDNGLTLWSY